MLLILGLIACTQPAKHDVVPWAEQLTIVEEARKDLDREMRLESIYVRRALSAGNDDLPLSIKYSFVSNIPSDFKLEPQESRVFYSTTEISVIDNDPNSTLDVKQGGYTTDQPIYDLWPYLDSIRITPRDVLTITQPEVENLLGKSISEMEYNFTMLLSTNELLPDDDSVHVWVITYRFSDRHLSYLVDAQTGEITKRPE